MMELYGHERHIQESGAKLVSRDNLGELYLKDMPGDLPLVMVKVINSQMELTRSIGLGSTRA